MTTAKQQPKTKDTTRCMRDVQDLAPSTFALPDDGRQTKHLQRQRKALAMGLARHANADGTQAYPAINTLMKSMGCSRSTIFRLLDDLKTLGFLQDGDIHGLRKTRVRTLDVQRMTGQSVSSSDDPSHLRKDDLSHLHGSPVSSSRVPVSSSMAPVSSSRVPVPKQDDTQPSSDRPSRPKETVITDRDAPDSGSVSSKQTGTQEIRPEPEGAVAPITEAGQIVGWTMFDKREVRLATYDADLAACHAAWKAQGVEVTQ